MTENVLLNYSSKNCFACGSILIKYQENIPNLIDIGWISLKIGNK